MTLASGPLLKNPLVVIVMSNTIPYLMPKLRWPARAKALAQFSDFYLGLFIAMSLTGMQLWSIAELAGPLMILLGFRQLPPWCSSSLSSSL